LLITVALGAPGAGCRSRKPYTIAVLVKGFGHALLALPDRGGRRRRLRRRASKVIEYAPLQVQNLEGAGPPDGGCDPEKGRRNRRRSDQPAGDHPGHREGQRRQVPVITTTPWPTGGKIENLCGRRELRGSQEARAYMMKKIGGRAASSSSRETRGQTNQDRIKGFKEAIAASPM